LLIYLGLVIFFVKNLYSFKFHLELKGINYYSKTRAVIFYVLWSLVLILTILLGIGMFTTLNEAKRILDSGSWFEPVTYLTVWLFVVTSLYTLVFDIQLSRKLKKQSDPSIGLLEERDAMV
jgi:hypothetical protein